MSDISSMGTGLVDGLTSSDIALPRLTSTLGMSVLFLAIYGFDGVTYCE